MSDEVVTLDDLAPSAPTVPNGEYDLEIVEAEFKTTKVGKGRYINYRVVIQSGQDAGRSLFGMWTTKPSEGKQDMSYLTRGDWKRLGITGIQRASDLIGVRGRAKVQQRPKKDRDTGEPTEELENVIKSWVGVL